MELLVVKPDAELKLGCLCRSTGDTGVELFVLVPDAELGPLRRSTGDLVPEDMELLVVKPDAELKLGCLSRSTGDTGVELFVLVPDAELGPLRRSTGDLVPEDMELLVIKPDAELKL